MNIDAIAPTQPAPPFVSLPAPAEQQFVSSQDAINAMVEFAKQNGYGMSLKRSKPDGKDAVKTRYYYHCDRHGNYSPKGTIRERVSRSTGCMFQILIQKGADDNWYLKVKNGVHNHGPMVSDRNLQQRQRKSLASSQQRKVFKIALIPGDGIGPEVMEAAKVVLIKLAQVLKKFDFQFESFPYGGDYYRQNGIYMPNDAIDKLKKHDAILLGAIGTPDISNNATLWGFRLPLRQELKQWVHVQHARVIRGIQSPLRNVSPDYINWVIIHETSEGEFSGHGGVTHKDSPYEIATDVSIFTRAAIDRVVRFAFDMAKSRPRRRLTLVTKSNGQKLSMILWEKIFAEAKREYPTVQIDQVQADKIAAYLISEPQSYDVILATNSHGDVLSNMAASLSGTTTIGPVYEVDSTRVNPGIFEPSHGSFVGLAGKQVANPLGILWAASEMIRWLGDDRAADFLMNCVENVTQWGCKGRDLGGQSGTAEITANIVSELERMTSTQ